jgi:hypothetical protein
MRASPGAVTADRSTRHKLRPPESELSVYKVGVKELNSPHEAGLCPIIAQQGRKSRLLDGPLL